MTVDEMRQVNELNCTCTDLLIKNDALKVENAKLRELIGRYVRFERDGCKDCLHEAECEAASLYDELCITGREIDSLAREFGIEVE